MPDSDGLYAALAAVQAELPRIAKDKQGKVEGTSKQGNAYSYTYDYAGLEDVTAVVLPLLGKHGLAFISKPTLSDGQFVLAYSLVHSGGSREDGEYPLPSSGTPQDIGKAITYARRYSLCAVTGVAPGGDDNDAQNLPSHPTARPRRKHTNAEHERLVESAEDRATHQPAERINGKAPGDEWTNTDPKWLAEIEDEIKKFTSDDYGRVLWRRVKEKVEAGGCSPQDGAKLQTLIRARHKALEVEQKPAEVPADAS